MSVIAEYKRRSPSADAFRDEVTVEEVARAYERGGAAALSVLTEYDHFGGSLDDLIAARRVTDIPVLRKDFTVDEYQVYEARAFGADAILLVVGAMDFQQLRRLYAVARELELDAIVEVHKQEELDAALDVDADVIGINNRDLESFEVELQVTFDLLTDVPAGKTVVSASGIHTRADVEGLEHVGVDAVLVGEALMRSPDPEAACRELARTEEPTQA